MVLLVKEAEAVKATNIFSIDSDESVLYSDREREETLIPLSQERYGAKDIADLSVPLCLHC